MDAIRHSDSGINTGLKVLQIDSELKATVTIGMPVYNAASTIRAALDSLLGQTYRDFVLVISDNASSDATEAICREYRAHDPRISYLRQSKTLSAAMNFRSVLFEARTPYFMWAAGDDLWAPRFIERTVAFLEAHSDYVCCQGRVLMMVNGRPSHYSSGTYALAEDWGRNVTQFFMNATDNSRIYGLFRTPVLQAVFPIRAFHAFDWAVSAATLKFGRHAELRDVLMIRDTTDIRNYDRQLLSDHKFVLWRIFPILFMTIYCLRHQFIPISLRTIYALGRLNFYMACHRGLYRFGRIGQRFSETGSLQYALLGRFSRFLAWINEPSFDAKFKALRASAVTMGYRGVRTVWHAIPIGTQTRCRIKKWIFEKKFATSAQSLGNYRSSECSAIAASFDKNRPPGPPLVLGNWRMPAPLAGRPAQLSIIIIDSDSIDFALTLIDRIVRAQEEEEIPLEVIICHAGPGDITPLLWKAADNIKCIHCDASLTYAAAANLAVQQATTRNVAFFNQRSLVNPSAIRKLVIDQCRRLGMRN
jgi:glycosyltransferase involved in cell wall biosynthesis